MSSLLRVAGVGKKYGLFSALTEVSLEIAEGEVFAIIGPNGAGKTTLFKVMTGEVLASTGSVSFLGQDISLLPAEERVRLGICRTFQVARVFPELTALDNVIVSIEARNRFQGEYSLWRIVPASEVSDEAHNWLGELGLDSLADTEARHLALGDRKRLELALTLALEPSLLMLDEPTAGMSPAERVGIIALLGRLKASLGLTIVLTEHDMDVVFTLAQRIMVMNQGRVVLTGTPGEIKASPLVQEIYLGRGAAYAHR